MSDAPQEARSFEAISPSDLARLHELGLAAFAEVCRDGNMSAIYRDELILTCFCQGAALHHQQCLDGVPEAERRGVHDFDVWGFFRRQPAMAFPPRWRGEMDFGASRFGKSPDDHREGRKVDVLGRSIDQRDGETAVEAVRRWIMGSGKSPWMIRQRPVFVISPGVDFGLRLWPASR